MNNKLKVYKGFIEKELIPLEPLLINHRYDELYECHILSLTTVGQLEPLPPGRPAEP